MELLEWIKDGKEDLHLQTLRTIMMAFWMSPVKDLDNQLDIYRKLAKGIPFKSRLKTKALKIDALKEAIRSFHTHESSGEEARKVRTR